MITSITIIAYLCGVIFSYRYFKRMVYTDFDPDPRYDDWGWGDIVFTALISLFSWAAFVFLFTIKTASKIHIHTKPPKWL